MLLESINFFNKYYFKNEKKDTIELQEIIEYIVYIILTTLVIIQAFYRKEYIWIVLMALFGIPVLFTYLFIISIKNSLKK